MGVDGGAELVNTSLKESVANGFLQYQYGQTYQVFTTNRTDTESVVLSASGLPAIGQTVVLAVSGQPIWCTSRTPARVAIEESATKWHVDCEFNNYTQTFERDFQGNPVTDPTEAVKRVDISYLEHSEEVDDAELLSITVGMSGFLGGQTLVPPIWMQNAIGPVTNSAKVPVRLTRPDYRKVIAVSQVYRDWNNDWDDFAGAINDDQITIEEKDKDGVRWSETYPEFTLRMRPPKKENVWKDARLYFRRTFIMEHNPNSWIHAELDAGTKRRVQVGQFKPDGGTYTQDDLDDLGIDGAYGYEEITTTTVDADGNKTMVAIGDPVKFNGHGSEMPTPQASSYDNNSQIYLNWRTLKLKSFGGLDL